MASSDEVKAPNSRSFSSVFPSESVDPLSQPEGRVLGGKFRVIRELGVGGMGAVYEVVHEITHHRRALKILKPKSGNPNPASATRLLREASAAGRIGNMHIVDTFDAGTLDSGETYVLMELLEGKTLFEYVRSKG